MFEIHMSVGPVLESRLRSLIKRKRELLMQLENWGIKPELLLELAQIEIQLAKFAERIFLMNERKGGRKVVEREKKRVLH